MGAVVWMDDLDEARGSPRRVFGRNSVKAAQGIVPLDDVFLNVPAPRTGARGLERRDEPVMRVTPALVGVTSRLKTKD